MNFNDDPEEAAFRAEIKAFIDAEAPKNTPRNAEGWAGGSSTREWFKKLAARRWIAPAWPVEYGGAGMSVMQQFIFNTELAEARVPRPGGIATGFAGPGQPSAHRRGRADCRVRLGGGGEPDARGDAGCDPCAAVAGHASVECRAS